MPRISHRRRHRSSRRDVDWFKRAALVAFALAGVGVLVGFCLLSPIGRLVLAGVGTVAALFAVILLSCITGRAAAGACNVVSRAAGRYSLEKFARYHRPHPSA